MITRDQFLAYEKVRREGAFNMFDLRNVCRMAGLTRAEALEIMQNYERLRREYLIEVLKGGEAK